MAVAGLIEGIPLKVRLRRAERTKQVRAILLVAPLFLFILITFLAPIGTLLFRSVQNPELPQYLPQTIAAMRGWDGKQLPDEAVFAAFAADLKVAQQNRVTAEIGKRVNYELPGTRSKILKTGREIAKLDTGPYKAAFVAIDPMWGEVGTWAVIRRASAPLTAFYWLNAVDRQQDAAGSIMRVPPDQRVFIDVYGRTFAIAGIVTLCTLILGFPVAYLLASLPTRSANLLMILVLVPFWTSLLVRTTAWFVLLQSNGIINDLADAILGRRFDMIFTRFGTIVAMTHIQLPFTLLPIYSVMKTIPSSHVRAARSLGAGPFYAFWRVYFPQTVPGIAAGCLLTFILCLGYYITPALVGGPTDQLVSSWVAYYMNSQISYGHAAALGAVLLIATLVLYWLYNRLVGIDKMKLG
ncbi:MAG TPA: ABC transporter permease [Dongiaceae bacterium]|jgi:putative spermidine/putrescine transport system permease protein|nr:ABC transporter permease [Dongiaceae bacterium]